LARSQLADIMAVEAKKTMQALILAGGEGRRMRHVTAHVPKPLLYVPGGTLLEHQLALLAELDVSHTYVVVHHQSDQLEAVLDGLDNVTALRQEPPFTLLGALASAQGHVDEPFIALHGDNYFSQSLEYVAEAVQNAPSGLEVDAAFVVDSETRHRDQARRLASSGCYVLTPEVLERVKALRHHDELWYLTAGLLDGGAVVEEVSLRGWRRNINTLEDLLLVSRRILDEWSASFHTIEAGRGLDRTEGLKGTHLPVWIALDSEVSDSDLGPHVVVGPGARVRDCALRAVIVFPGAEIAQQTLEGSAVVPTREGSVVLTSEDEIHTG
jgi:NDP-sugar pyrophosphorylase family protein